MPVIENPALATDGYKLDHRRQYPKGTSFVFSNLTARSARLSNVPREAHNDSIVFFGLSAMVQTALMSFWDIFFSSPLEDVVKDYTDHLTAYLGPNEIGDQHIRDLHALGYLPVKIRAVPEGTIVPIQVPCLTIENTVDDFFWVTNYLETIISCEMWKPITNATTANAYRKLIDRYCDITGGSPDFVPFQGHDFSFRGMSGYQDACLSGVAHLTSFLGTDTVPAIKFAEKYYRGGESEVIGMSVPATEHSVMSMGTQEDEIGTFDRFITETYPTGIVSIVSDTWDFWQVMTEFTVKLKDKIMARDGKTVFRPDSGDPVKIICGYSHDGVIYEDKDSATNAILETCKLSVADDNIKYDDQYDVINIGGTFFEVLVIEAYYGGDWMVSLKNPKLTEAEVKGSVEVLWDIFGGTMTEKGYKTLDSHVGMIYGDSITYERCEAILKGLEAKGFSSDNVVFGIGSFTYQYVTRDTYGMAVKATFGIVNDEHRVIQKDPKTGSGKKSARGLLAVVKDSKTSSMKLIEEVPYDEYMAGVEGDVMETVFEDGKIIIRPSLEEIRQRLSTQR